MVHAVVKFIAGIRAMQKVDLLLGRKFQKYFFNHSERGKNSSNFHKFFNVLSGLKPVILIFLAFSITKPSLAS